MMKTFVLLLAVSLCTARFVKTDVEGPACADDERYECNGVTSAVPDPNDCTIFYNCDSNIQRPCPSTCPAGLVFDPSLGLCNWPSAVPSCTI